MTEQREEPASTTAHGRASRARGAIARIGLRQRLALGAAALIGPLALVGAVGAATGDEPLDGPVEAVASVVGIGGNSGETRNDYDNRSATAGDVGQPGSCPGSACEAPGLNPDEDEAGEDATAEDDDTPEATDDDTPEDTDAVEGEDTFDPHANGKGCDDKLFAEGEPPFGGHETPVGPCNEDEEADGEEPADASDPAADVQSEPGSNGNGYGHEKGQGAGHEKGQGQGHVKHGDGAGTTPEGEAGGADEPSGATTGPGASGNANGKGKNK